ncbi:D-amino-acid transaminase [Rhodoplanes sp. TEM]|uniref:Probable branched-chain-amino-acid aminotransferase n=1 Tax=Rhodoplanes tepidamans TaxID=200616 RepID=A0ABT5JK04_RHOTP|nr:MULTISPECIES: D-amino-acid transaminase [Rhodoplanes]MDC7789818.1 D-amino-acid transaminase [Rhodoplanes tepidamans]MDC7987473.1 D-amino-acid transaminase [Rhodoplanes sp. TEM]MDQ0359230.1 D-alanine transaminase [Rhodoplanes tepidamans]
MSRVVYVNGQWRPHRAAMVHVEDRGYQFGDGVYEVCEVQGGRLVDERRHTERLLRSLSELRIPLPLPVSALSVVLHETVRRNRMSDGIVYLQVTRGVARRDHGFPPAGTRPSLVVSARRIDPAIGAATARTGIAVVTLPETRWARVDIKAVALLPNVLAKQAAREQGAREAWFVDRDGFVTEGASSNAWIVTATDELVTRPVGPDILRGISREVVKDAARAGRLTLVERPFTVAEALAAREAFVTAASQIVMPVVRIDGHAVGGGVPGPVAAALRAAFHRHAEFS